MALRWHPALRLGSTRRHRVCSEMGFVKAAASMFGFSLWGNVKPFVRLVLGEVFLGFLAIVAAALTVIPWLFKVSPHTEILLEAGQWAIILLFALEYGNSRARNGTALPTSDRITCPSWPRRRAFPRNSSPRICSAPATRTSKPPAATCRSLFGCRNGLAPARSSGTVCCCWPATKAWLRFAGGRLT